MASSSTAQRFIYCLVGAVAIALIGMAALSYKRTKDDRSVPVKSMASWQTADAPLGFPVSSTTPEFDPRFIQLTAFERAAIPTSHRMTHAMGSEHGALTYNAQPFWSDNPKRGGHHTGDDINGIGGMNTDLGDPVYALANGLVIYRGEPSPGWGKSLILAHRTPAGKIILSMYAHLHSNDSPYGHLVYAGETIGTVGTANNNYPAHLHLEMRDSTGVFIGRGYLPEPKEHLDPHEIIPLHQPYQPEAIPPSPLAIVLADRLRLQNEQLKIQHQTGVTK